jgi:NADPH:quinone reductase-like Zn-dependent oxidoreductase
MDCGSAGCELRTEAKALYSVIVLGATGDVGVRIVQLLIRNPRCRKVVMVTRRKTDAFAHPKVSDVVVNMDRLQEEVAPHAQGIDVALAAFGVGKGSARCRWRRYAGSKSHTRRAFAALPRLQALVCAGL